MRLATSSSATQRQAFGIDGATTLRVGLLTVPDAPERDAIVEVHCNLAQTADSKMEASRLVAIIETNTAVSDHWIQDTLIRKGQGGIRRSARFHPGRSMAGMTARLPFRRHRLVSDRPSELGAGLVGLCSLLCSSFEYEISGGPAAR